MLAGLWGVQATLSAVDPYPVESMLMSSLALQRVVLVAACLLWNLAGAADVAKPDAPKVAQPAASADKSAAAGAEVRLYALDCGRLEFKEMGFFSDTGEYDGTSGKLFASCYVIKHPKGTLLWDTGLGDKIAESPQGVDLFGGLIHESVPVTLQAQLKEIGLAPADVSFVAFSHLHADHAGNANLFAASTWILNPKEVAWATATPPPLGVDPSVFSSYKNAKTQSIDGDYDVFGDGSVKILKAPGHTPGHAVLQVKLKKAGVVILSGDLYHLRESRAFGRVPTFNDSRADSLASIARIEKIVKNTKARFVIQHNGDDFKTLPKFPAFLD